MIYDPSDARNLVTALGSNVTKSQTIIEDLKSASSKLLSTIGPGTKMTGAAIEAGRGMFSQLVIPAINKAAEAIDKVSSEKDKLNALIGPAGGELLDEDKLNEQLQEKQQQQSNINSMISLYRTQGALHSDDSQLSTMYGDFQRQWGSFLGTVEQDIQDIQDKLKKLHTFNSGANALFTDSLNDLKVSMSGVLVLNNAKIDKKTGKFAIPSDVLDYASNALQGATLDSFKELISKIDSSTPNPGNFVTASSNGVLGWQGSSYGKAFSSSMSKKAFKAATVGEVGIGECKTSGLGALGFGLDYLQNRNSGESVGEAFGHTAVTTVVATAGVSAIEVGIGAAATTGIGTSLGAGFAAAAIASNPIGWAILGGVVVGGLATYAYNHNLGGMKDSAKTIGKAIDSGLNSIGKFFGGTHKHA